MNSRRSPAFNLPVSIRRRSLRAVLVLAGVLAGVSSAWSQVVLSRTFAVNEPIPDVGERVDVQTFGVPGTTVSKVVVSLEIAGFGDGGFNGDLYAALSHDTAFSVLLNRPGRRSADAFGYADDGFEVALDDAATDDVHNYRVALSGQHEVAVSGGPTGSWQPDGRLIDPTDVPVVDTPPRDAKLATQIGRPADGEWRLLLADASAGGTSQLVAWGLAITTPSLGSSPVSLADSTLEFLGVAQEVIAPIALSGTVSITGTATATFASSVTGTGSLVQSGPGELVLSGANDFSGGLRIEAGVVTVASDFALGGGSVTLAGGTLRASAGSWQIENPFAVEAASTIETVGDLTIEGVLSGSGTLSKTGAGQLELAAANPDFTGTNVVEAGTLLLTGSLGTGTIQVSQSGVLAGTGTAGPVSISSGGTLSPGSSPETIHLGPTTWEDDGIYVWEINAAAGTAGSDPGWDLTSITGSLSITASSGAPFTVKLVTLQADNTPGPMVGFDSQQRYTWTIATASGGIAGFSAQSVLLNTDDVANSLGIGRFLIGVVDNDLQITFDPAGPTAARLESFRAVRAEGETVQLRWRTLVEWSLLGFRLYRSAGVGEWELLTRALVPATGQDQRPQDYFYEDRVAGQHRYRLVEVDLAGQEHVLAEADLVAGITVVPSSLLDQLSLLRTGDPGQTVGLESTTCLAGPWEPSESLLLDARGSGRFEVEVRNTEPVRFFRVLGQ